MPSYEIVVVAGPNFISERVRTAWAKIDITLAGPISPDMLDDSELRRSGGVLLDVSLDAALLFALSERLVLFEIPFLFVVNRSPAQGATQPFILNDVQDDMTAILMSLAHEEIDATGSALH